MAAVSDRTRERRRMPRLAPETTGWREEALIRPGVTVRIVNIGPLGALLESPTRMRPGLRTELHLTANHAARKLVLSGRVGRCQIAGLGPLRFRGSVEFDEIVELREFTFG